VDLLVGRRHNCDAEVLLSKVSDGLDHEVTLPGTRWCGSDYSRLFPYTRE
jgi:hypothetical protein